MHAMNANYYDIKARQEFSILSYSSAVFVVAAAVVVVLFYFFF